MWENSQAIRGSAEFQINFKPLSPVNAKPQQLSCCDLILFSALSPLFLNTQQDSFLLKGEAWNTRPISNTRQESQIFPEPPPPRYGHLLDQLWKRQILWTWATNQWQVLAWVRVRQTSWSSTVRWSVSVTIDCSLNLITIPVIFYFDRCLRLQKQALAGQCDKTTTNKYTGNSSLLCLFLGSFMLVLPLWQPNLWIGSTSAEHHGRGERAAHVHFAAVIQRLIQRERGKFGNQSEKRCTSFHCLCTVDYNGDKVYI